MQPAASGLIELNGTYLVMIGFDPVSSLIQIKPQFRAAKAS
jgi:hypothetical protein